MREVMERESPEVLGHEAGRCFQEVLDPCEALPLEAGVRLEEFPD